MVVAEVALALMLLVGAGLLIRSFVNLTSVSPGFRTSRRRVDRDRAAARRAMRAARRRSSSIRRSLDGVRALPGVMHAGAVSALPLSPLGTQFDIPFTIDGLDATPRRSARARRIAR